MRKVFAVALVLGIAQLAPTQPPPPAGPPAEVPPRFGVPYRPKTFPQADPKLALRSVIEAADKAEFPYLVAHLMDPAFVDARLAERARQLEPAVEVEYAKLRDFQKANPDRFPPDVRLPEDPAMFKGRVQAEARTRAFRQFVRDVQDKLVEDPEVLKDLRRFAREGTFGEGAEAIKVGHPDIRDRSVYLKKVGDRWFMENRQTDEGKAPEPAKEPEKKPEEKK